jgi:putative DNA primase/helicase
VLKWYPTGQEFGRNGNRKQPCCGVGWVTGNVSGNLEVLEFDAGGEVYQAFKDRAEQTGLGEVVERIEAGYSSASPTGGIHWPYRCDVIDGNTKLARRPKRPEEQRDPKDTVQVLIETRGEGGYIVEAPSNGNELPWD